MLRPPSALPLDEDHAGLDARLRAVRDHYYEQPAEALAAATAAHEFAHVRDEHALCARARALQGMVSLHRGDLRGALGLVVAAQRSAETAGDDATAAEVAALEAQISFFTGAHVAALGHAERAVALADRTDDLRLRIYARRTTCLVFGNLAVADLRERIDALLALTLESGDRWEEAISRNDLACNLAEAGEVAAAEAEIERAFQALAAAPGSRFAFGVVHSTRADIRLAADRPAEALADAEAAMGYITEDGDPSPYVLAATVRAEVQARMALGQLEHARQSGEGALDWLGDRVPQMRSFILATLASELRAAGRLEEAYDALARSAELERQAFVELAELQRELERSTLEAEAARRERDQLRELADRDWLTGLHNRRYLARQLEDGRPDRLAVPLALAVLDRDRFKQINDRFGHEAGDRVLVSVAGLLCDALREHDIVVRNGGEEFLLVMSATDLNAAAAGCERVRLAIESADWSDVAGDLTVTASIGLAVAYEPAAVHATVSLADQRLYDAKRLGRNRVVIDETRAAESARGPEADGSASP
jgi:diguanylate cyclase (GGDEF)-like protein